MPDDKQENAPSAPPPAPPAPPEHNGEPQGKGTPGRRIPAELPILPLRGLVLYPDMVLPLVINNERDVAVIDAAVLAERMVALTPLINPEANPPTRKDLFQHACAGVVLKMLKFPDDTTRVLVQGLARISIDEITQDEPFFKAKITVAEEKSDKGVKANALFRSIRDQFQKLIGFIPQFPEEMKVASMNITEPGRFADLVAANINLTASERAEILAMADVNIRLERLSMLLGRELQVAELGNKIQSDVQEKVAKGQRDFFLREQIKSIKKELGDEDNNAAEIEDLKERLDKAALPEEAAKEAQRELKRLETMQPGSAEYTVSRTYLDWMATLPWSKQTEDRLDVKRARKILDSDHYDLVKIKDRIVEYLAVRKLNPGGKGPILCFAGPPGVGKTSLGKSIARALGREFVRISLGGVRDEAEIRGHRRTYVGALPGRIIQGLRKAGTRNPVFMMDEIDKLASDFRGDPASALLEVLDPEQNNAFSDHYLDAAFDLSKIMFITTANQLEPIPPALLDRMEVLNIPGYSEEEKLLIAQRHIVKRLTTEHGLKKSDIVFTPQGIRTIIAEYTREAGLRNLEREMARVARKVAVRRASGKRGCVTITTDKVHELLGPPIFHNDVMDKEAVPGVVMGLAWTPSGGDVLFIEAARMAGKGNLILTGKLGEVMQESARAALSWIRAHEKKLNIDAKVFQNNDLHIHFPEGAIPKDGPSAGITMIVTLVSLLTNRPISPKLAMTGELTLRGRVLPVGGIKEKMLAARRFGITDVILPKQNENDLLELPPEIKRDLAFHPVETIEEGLAIAFPKDGKRPAGKKIGKTIRKPRRKGK